MGLYVSNADHKRDLDVTSERQLLLIKREMIEWAT